MIISCNTIVDRRDHVQYVLLHTGRTTVSLLKLSLVTGSIWRTEHALTGPSGMLEIILRTPRGLVSFKKLSLVTGSIWWTENVLTKPGGM